MFRLEQQSSLKSGPARKPRKEDALNAKTLTLFLKSVIPEHAGQWIGDELLVMTGRRFRWDCMYLMGGKRFAVEYDGHRHYMEMDRQYKDDLKDSYASRNAVTVIRFPYWIQLDSITCQFFFKLDIKKNPFFTHPKFPHGFITTKYFPIAFNESWVDQLEHVRHEGGRSRFESELKALPNEIVKEVLQSLRERQQGPIPVVYESFQRKFPSP
jgi:hypothetical protein